MHSVHRIYILWVRAGAGQKKKESKLERFERFDTKAWSREVSFELAMASPELMLVDKENSRSAV